MCKGMRLLCSNKCVLKLPDDEVKQKGRYWGKKCELMRFSMSCNNYGRSPIEHVMSRREMDL
jgi:hypothetical protein